MDARLHAGALLVVSGILVLCAFVSLFCDRLFPLPERRRGMNMHYFDRKPLAGNGNAQIATGMNRYRLRDAVAVVSFPMGAL